MYECSECGALISSHEMAENHMIVQHAEPVIDALIRKALREAIEIAELNRIFSLK